MPVNIAEHNALVSVLVVSYRSVKFLGNCFDAVFRSTYSPLDVVMFDSASKDGSVEFTRSAFPNVRVIEGRSNPGFAGACNEAIPHTRGKYVFLLNPDTVVEPRCIELLVQAMEKDSSIGICGAKMLFGWQPELINSVGHSVNQIFWGWDRGCFEWDRGQYDAVKEVPSVCGGAALYRRSVFDELGYFDTRFFMYTEDVDYGLRANLAGYRVLVVPAARVYHWISLKVSEARHHQFFEHKNRLRDLLKNAPSEMLFRSLKESLRFDLESIRALARSGHRVEAAWRIRALLWNLFWLPDTLIERARIQRHRRVPVERVISLLDPGTGLPLFGAPAPDHNFLRDDTLDPARIKTSFRVGDDEEGHLGLGWYARETLDEKLVRWTGDYAFFYLSVPEPLDPSKSFLSIEGANPLGVTANWYINGEPAEELSETANGFSIGPVPRSKIAKVVIKIENPKGDPNVPYWRPRGIAVSAAKVSCSKEH